MMLDELRSLLFDQNRPVLEHLVVGGLILLGGLQHRHRLDLGLRRVINPTEQVTVGVGHCQRAKHATSLSITPDHTPSTDLPNMRRFVISELSMSPALTPGDTFLARRLRRPQRGVVALFPHPHRPELW